MGASSLTDFGLAQPGTLGQTICAADWLWFLNDSLHIQVDDNGQDLVLSMLQRQLE